MGYKKSRTSSKGSYFLLSDFSEAVTGEIIHADGGTHAIGGTMLDK
jgi:Enoyl-[acyl-carrier-protein] reductase (NADH)